MTSEKDAPPLAPNAFWLLWAGFMAILAAGVGFAIRTGIYDNWGSEFGFNASQLGAIGGAGFTGFCFGIIIGGMLADKIGYGKLVAAAFLFHVASAGVTFMAVKGADPQLVYSCLYWGAFLFAVANGTLEAVANPLVATLFPHNRTHYLNILHASWPAGLIIGSALGWVLDDQLKLDWRMQFSIFLVPTLIYGAMFVGQKMPKSEASQKGLSLAEMFKDVGILGGLVVCYLLSRFFGAELIPPVVGALGLPDAIRDSVVNYGGYAIGGALLVAIAVMTKFSLGSPLLFILFIAHALVGAVELGTDNWLPNITGNILTSEQGKFLFVFTSSVMFLLRFCADFIEKKIGLSPLGILFICSILAVIGLNLTARIETITMAFVALTIYGIGKTFFWPTMLAVASDRFPRTGAVAISIMGGIGMMSAGLVGAPGLGYFKDRYATEELKKVDAALYEEYKSATPSKFLFFDEVNGLDGKKLGEVRETAKDQRSEAQQKVAAADIQGDRNTLVTDSLIPATMAVIYLGLIVYFASIGGYKPITLAEEEAMDAPAPTA